MMTPSDPSLDAFRWWEDKQVAVLIDGDVVRGWVVRARSSPSGRTASSYGVMTVLLLVVNPVLAEQYPSEVSMPIQADGGHGRPAGVTGLWPEEDRSDVHSQRQMAPVTVKVAVNLSRDGG